MTHENLSKNETEWSLTPHEWTLTPTLHCQVEPEPADLHAIVCVHCPFTLFYPMNRQSFQHPSPCLVLLSLHNKWLPMDCVPLRHYVLRHRGLLQSSVLQMRSVLLDALLCRSTSLSNVNHRAIHASQRVHARPRPPSIPARRQFVLRPFHERPFQRVWSRHCSDVDTGLREHTKRDEYESDWSRSWSTRDEKKRG